MVFSNGEIYNFDFRNNKLYKRINVLKSKLSKKIKGSNNYNKLNNKILKLNLRFKLLIENYYKQFVNKLNKTYNKIFIQDENISQWKKKFRI